MLLKGFYSIFDVLLGLSNLIIFLINLFLFFDFMGGLIFPILCHLSLDELGDVLEDDGFEIELILLMGCIFADFF